MSGEEVEAAWNELKHGVVWATGIECRIVKKSRREGKGSR